MYERIQEGDDTTEGIWRVIEGSVEDRSGSGIKERLEWMCKEVQDSQRRLGTTGKSLLVKLLSIKDFIRRSKGSDPNEESSIYEYPVNSLTNIIKNMEVLILDIEEKAS